MPRFFKDSILRFAFSLYESRYWGRGEWSPLTAFEGCLSLFNLVKVDWDVMISSKDDFGFALPVLKKRKQPKEFQSGQEVFVTRDSQSE